MSPAPGEVSADLVLHRPDGSSVTLGELLTAPLTVVQLVRYFGCLPCQDWLIQLDRAAPAWAPRGVGAIAVGGSADYQAQWLASEQGVRIPLLLDPEHRLREGVGAAELLGAKLLDPRGAAAYVRSLRTGLRPQRITRDTTRSPGVVVLDRDGVVRWQYVGRRIGDYPPLDEVGSVVSDLAR